MRKKFIAAICAVIMIITSLPLSVSAAVKLPGVPSGYDITKSFGANGNDRYDDTNAFQKAFDYIRGSKNMTLIYVPAGTYYISRELKIYSNTYLKLDSAAKIVRINESNYLFTNGSDDGVNGGGYSRSHDITVDGGTWDGHITNTNIAKGLAKIWHAKNINILNSKFENCCGAHFIVMEGVANVNVLNTKFSNFYEFTAGDAEYRRQTKAKQSYRAAEALHIDYVSKNPNDPSPPADGTPSKNIVVNGCTFDNCASGVGTHNYYSYMRSDNIDISGNVFRNCHFYCVNGGGFTNFRAYNNSAQNCGGFLYGELISGKIYNNTISSKENLTGTMYFHDPFTGGKPFFNAFRISHFSNVELYGNTVYNSTGNGIYILEKSSFKVRDNKVYNTKMNGIAINDGCVGKIYRNTIVNADYNGVSVKNSSYMQELGRNTITSVSDNGIYVNNATVGASRFNDISNCGKNGYSFAYNSKGSCDNNDISGCRDQGIYINGYSNVTAYSNYVHDNGRCAFRVTNHSTANLTQNNIRNNKGYDLHVSGGSKGVKFKNNGSNKRKTKVDSGCNASIGKSKKCLFDYSFNIPTSYTYSGSKLRPAVSTKMKKKNYSVSYGGNTNTGEGSVKITGKGDYAGSYTLRFNIVPKKQTIRSMSSNNKTISFTWNYDSQCTGYQICYSTSSNFSTYYVTTVTDKRTCSAVLKNLQKGKRYYVKVSGYKNFNGRNYAGQWSNVWNVVVK